jgi:lipoprotein-anchoring transpeptidase ErfK/SrfK
MNASLLFLRKHVLTVICAVLLALLLTIISQVTGANRAIATSASGKVIMVSITEQKLYAYEDGNVVYSTLVMTGRKSLPTPPGTFSILAKLSPTMFISPWPYGSPNWYPPTYINYAMEFKPGGFFLHDATWHSVFGPGTNDWHYDPQFGWQDGSHGCVAMPLSAAAWLYNWTSIGTVVNIYA